MTSHDDLIVHCSKAGHGRMARREHPDKLAASLGEWFDCQHPTCHDSVLVQPDDLLTPDEIARSER